MKVLKLLSIMSIAGGVSAGATNQLLAFTSARSSDVLTMSPAQSVSGFVHSLFAPEREALACSLDAIAVISVQDVHFSRNSFAGLSQSSTSLRARALDASNQVTFTAASDVSAAAAIREASRLCDTPLREVNLQSGQLIASPTTDSKLNLVHINVQDLRREEGELMKTLASLDEAYPHNLVIIHSSAAPSNVHKRQIGAAPFASSGNWTEPVGGVFARYQLFSTPLLLTLLIVGGLLMPIVYFAVSQLAQIQTPDQMGVRKDPITGDKKNA